MKREFSAGGVVFRKSPNNKLEILLINNAAMKDPSKSYWGFPKGHVEGKELPQEAAIREIKEETGLDVEVIEKIGDSKYVYTRDGEKIFKVVILFLMKYSNGDLKVQDAELLGAKWISPNKALKMLSYTNDKNLLRLALQKLV